MRKQPKKQRVPRTRADNTMTEAGFWTFIRTNLRLISCKWVPRRRALEASRRPNQSDNKRLKWEHQCSQCLQWFPHKQVEVDHVIPVGSLLAYSDLPGYVERLLCEVDGFVVLCERCHNVKTHGSQKEVT
jgi:5-methylcytosine-specific restriction endonuclease McrA